MADYFWVGVKKSWMLGSYLPGTWRQDKQLLGTKMNAYYKMNFL